MSHSYKALAAFVLLAVVAACSARETVVVTDAQPAAITTEPVFTGKYGN